MSQPPVPTHLKEILVVNEPKTKDYSFEGRVRCTCGTDKFRIKHNLVFDKDHIWRPPYDETLSYYENPGVKVTAECIECRKSYVLIDEATQGFSGYVCHDHKPAEDDSLKEYLCEKCEDVAFRAYISIEPEDYEQFIDECEEFESEEYIDAFNGIAITLTCAKCKKKIELVALELS